MLSKTHYVVSTLLSVTNCNSTSPCSIVVICSMHQNSFYTCQFIPKVNESFFIIFHYDDLMILFVIMFYAISNLYFLIINSTFLIILFDYLFLPMFILIPFLFMLNLYLFFVFLRNLMNYPFVKMISIQQIFKVEIVFVNF